MKITKKNIDLYLKGSQFLATGGGLPLHIHKQIFDQILTQKNEISPISIGELSDDDYLISAYGVGDPSIIPADFGRVVINAFQKYRKLTQKKIKGIIPGEIGAEGLAFLISQITDIPVVDADLVGGRAAPEIQLDVFSVYDLSITPVLLVAMNGKSIYLEGKFLAQEIEKISRDFFAQNGSSGILIGYGISSKEFFKYAITGTLTYALQIGRFLEKNDIVGLVNLCGGAILCVTKIQGVDLKSVSGFSRGNIVCTDGTMFVKNENIVFLDLQERPYTAPDILMFVDDCGMPIHNTCMESYVGKYVMLIHVPAAGYWALQKARGLWQSLF